MAEHRPPGLCARRSCTPLMLFPCRQRASNPLDAQAEGLCSRNFMSSGVETPPHSANQWCYGISRLRSE